MEDCFFCAAAADPDDPARLVVHHLEHHLIMLNRYPYTNGHLMIAPKVHAARPEDTGEEALREFWPCVLEARQVLAEAYHPDGFNLGLNLGSAAGAGVPDHFHFHVVPRWSGDTSFTTAIGGVRLVPEDLETTRGKLTSLFAARAT